MEEAEGRKTMLGREGGGRNRQILEGIRPLRRKLDFFSFFKKYPFPLQFLIGY